MNINPQPPEKVVLASDEIVVHSIFPTIQGEGPFAGKRAIFIRLAGCNLQCPMCDTEYTSKRTPLNVAALLAYVAELTSPRPELVVITGGEPLRQPIEPLCVALLDAGFIVQIETNGTLYRNLPFDHPRFTVVCSPKTHYVNPRLVWHIKALKYVATVASLENSKDGLPNKALDHPLHKKTLFRPPHGWPGEVYLQPVDEQNVFQNQKNLLAVVQSCVKHGHRLCLQLHKLIGVE
jgi:organic radical activating enzyme